MKDSKILKQRFVQLPGCYKPSGNPVCDDIIDNFGPNLLNLEPSAWCDAYQLLLHCCGDKVFLNLDEEQISDVALDNGNTWTTEDLSEMITDLRQITQEKGMQRAQPIEDFREP